MAFIRGDLLPLAITVAARGPDQSFVTAADQMAERFVAAIEPRGVGAQEQRIPPTRLAFGVSIRR
jgi:hypothetical protein